MTEPITEAALARIETRALTARAEIHDLCQGKKWRMRIPARKDDSDVVLTATVDDNRALVAALRAAWRERDEARKASDNGWSNVNRINHELALVMVALNEVELEHNGVTSWKPLAERVRALGAALAALTEGATE